MPFQLSFSPEAATQIAAIKRDLPKKYKKVHKTLAFLQESGHGHPSLRAHHFSSMSAPGNAPVWEVYVENNTPAAYRLFFYYPKGKRGNIYVVAVTQHP